jgi:hypothetical protein
LTKWPSSCLCISFYAIYRFAAFPSPSFNIGRSPNGTIAEPMSSLAYSARLPASGDSESDLRASLMRAEASAGRHFPECSFEDFFGREETAFSPGARYPRGHPAIIGNQYISIGVTLLQPKKHLLRLLLHQIDGQRAK